MSTRMLQLQRICSRAAPARRVRCACTPDLDRPRLENKVLDVTEPAPFSASSAYAEVDTFTPVAPATLTTEQWLTQPPISGVQVTTTEASVPLVPSEDEVEKEADGIGAYLMQTAPVRYYMHQLEINPLTTKCWTSFTGFFLGDIVAQLLTEPDFVISRTLILASYGFFIDAPAGNAFYTWMDKTIQPDKPKSAKAVGTKIAIDQLLYAPVFTCVLYIFLQSAALDFESIPSVLDAKVLPTLLANYTIWPLAHGLNFYFVPTEQRILYNNFVAVCWTTWLSFIAH